DVVHPLRARSLEVRPEHTASPRYAPGTTCLCRGVVLTHSNIASNVKACERLFPLGGHDVAISFLPLSHVYERMLDYTYFSLGVSIAYAESFDALPRNLLEVRRSEEHTSELQSRSDLVCRLLLEKKQMK